MAGAVRSPVVHVVCLEQVGEDDLQRIASLLSFAIGARLLAEQIEKAGTKFSQTLASQVLGTLLPLGTCSSLLGCCLLRVHENLAGGRLTLKLRQRHPSLGLVGSIRMGAVHAAEFLNDLHLYRRSCGPHAQKAIEDCPCHLGFEVEGPRLRHSAHNPASGSTASCRRPGRGVAHCSHGDLHCLRVPSDLGQAVARHVQLV